jgi:hypothetical protein
MKPSTFIATRLALVAAILSLTQACRTMSDVVKNKDEGTVQVYPVNSDQAWKIAMCATVRSAPPPRSALLLSGGLLVSPQVGAAADAAVSPAVSLGLMARAGRMLILGDNVDPAVLGGRRAITIPLALLLTIAVRL